MSELCSVSYTAVPFETDTANHAEIGQCVFELCTRRTYGAQDSDRDKQTKQEAQLMLTTGSTRLAVSRGQRTWYHFRSIATFRYACGRQHALRNLAIAYVTFILALCCRSDATGPYTSRHYLTE